MTNFIPILSGFLSGMDGVHRKLPSYEIPAGNRTLTKLSQSSSGLSEALPRIPIYGSRAIHATRTLPEATRGVVMNRPLSPHLPVKKPQLSATYSISHRIFGASLASAILLIPIAWKLSLSFDV